MKLERIPELVTTATAIVGGLLFAFFAGRLTGDGQTKMVIASITASIIIALAISMRAGIWLLIPLCWELTGRIPPLDLPVSIRDLSILIVLGCYLVFYALKIIRFRQPFELMDILIVACLVNLGTVYMRNPVGSSWMGSEMVGGRPYFDIFIAFVAFWLLCRAPIDLKIARRMPIMLLLGSAFISFGSLMTIVLPGSERALGQLYSAFAPTPYQPGAVLTEDTIGRKPLLSLVGNTGMRLLTSYFSPVTFLLPLYPLRFLGTILFTLAILMSGFRSAILTVFAYVCLSSYFRRRSRDVIFFVLIGGIGLGIIALGNGRLFDLPLPAQRALSFLPGNWNHEATMDGQGSSEWRYQIWRRVLTEDKWIQNKLLGDGFGFTRNELSIMESATGFAGAASQDLFLIAGTYHSGPLSTIRYVGVVGLILYIPLMLILAFRAARIIRSCEGSDLFPVALFVGMPVIFAPFPFVFVAGGFDTSFAESLFAAGLLRLLERASASLPVKPVLTVTDTPERRFDPPSRRPQPALPAQA